MKDTPWYIVVILAAVVITVAALAAGTVITVYEGETVEKIVEVERDLTAREQAAIDCYDLFDVWWDTPEDTLEETRALDAVFEGCVP